MGLPCVFVSCSLALSEPASNHFDAVFFSSESMVALISS